MSKRTNISECIGKKFNKLTIVGYEGVVNGHSKVKCVCDCGNIVIVDLYKTKTSHTKSCGCAKHKARNDIEFHRLYRIWVDMKYRCNNKNFKSYHRYGGRGIKVCQEWEKAFDNFKEWALANGYLDDLTIDRIDTNGNYEPSNCKWSTKTEQANNRNTNIFLTFNGEMHTISEWSRLTGINKKTISERLKRNWKIEKILKTEV